MEDENKLEGSIPGKRNYVKCKILKEWGINVENSWANGGEKESLLLITECLKKQAKEFGSFSLGNAEELKITNIF